MPVRREERERYDFDRDVWLRLDFLSLPDRRPEDRPEPPLPPLGRWIEGDRPERAPRAPGEWLPAVAAGLTMIVAALGLAYATFFSAFADLLGVSGLAMSGLLFVVGVIILCTLSETYSRATPDDEALLEDAEDLSVCPIEVTVYQNGVVTGTDRGAAWLAENCLFFCGHRTSFVVGGEYLTKPPSWTPEGLQPEVDGALYLRHPQRTVMVALTPLHREGDPDGKAALRFGKALREFRKRAPTGRVASQYPPLAIDPWLKISKAICFAQIPSGHVRQTLRDIQAEEPNPPEALTRSLPRLGGST